MTDCIHRSLGLLCSPISWSQLKAESWIAGSPEHKTQWQVDARIYTQPWTVNMNCQNSNAMSWVSQILTRETNWNYVRRACLDIAYCETGTIWHGTGPQPSFSVSVDTGGRGNDSSVAVEETWDMHLQLLKAMTQYPGTKRFVVRVSVILTYSWCWKSVYSLFTRNNVYCIP